MKADLSQLGDAMPTVQSNTKHNNHKRSYNHKNGRVRSLLVLLSICMTGGLLLCATELLHRYQFAVRSWDQTTTTTRSASTATTTSTNKQSTSSAGSSAATGQRFQGPKVRDFPAGRRQFRASASFQLRSKHQKQEKKEDALTRFLVLHTNNKKCTKWAVVTTIYEPSEAVLRMGSNDDSDERLEDWCMVIVADTKTPTNYMANAGWATTTNPQQQQHKVVFLSVADQLELATLVPFVQQTPFQSFARKNIGYLYAIWMGATVIFDFDDDNLLRSNITDPETTLSGTELLQSFSNTTNSTIMVRHVSISQDYPDKAFNPFPMMGASLPDTWPRGLPLSLINDKMSRGQPGPLMLKEVSLDMNVAIIQSTCDHDPDVDAIYRLSRPLPFSFDSSKTKPMTLQVPPHLYAPYNAQATLHFPTAFWGLYLPMTVTGRVSDIWRSYIVQRLLKELQNEAYLLYSPPLVTQYRNAHDYVGDFAAEEHLYHRTEALLDFLDEWTPSASPSTEDYDASDNLQARIEDLWINLYERQYVELEDVEAVQEWLSALAQGGYTFPTVRDHSKSLPDPSKDGVKGRQECARQRLAQWEEPEPTMMNGSNYGALTFQNAGNVSLARLLAEYEVDHPFPHSIDLICRAGGKHNPHELAVMVESIQLYWPKCAGRVVLVLDRGDEDFAHEHIPPWIDVMYSEFDYNMPGRLGNQLFNIYSDQQGRSEYVAIFDSDTALVTPVTPDLIFNMDKVDESGNVAPIILTETQYQKGMWSTGDEWMFQGDSNDWTFMVTLPQVFPRAMFPQYRAGVEAIHNNEFETIDLWEHFRQTVRLGWMGMSQFSLLGNWMVKHWKDAPFDLRNETDIPSIRYGVHLPYHRGIDFGPGGAGDPASFQKGGRRVIADGLCELFCSSPDSASASREQIATAPPTLGNCASLCPHPIDQPRQMYFKYEKIVYGTPEEHDKVVSHHFQPFRAALTSILFQKHHSNKII